MNHYRVTAKINVKVLFILIGIIGALTAALFAARHIRRAALSKRDLAAGEAAFKAQDWPTANKHFQEYLGRNPDDIEILKKYAKARLSLRPLDAGIIAGALAVYRRVIQLDPLDEIPYEELARLYQWTGNYEELAYIARTCLGHIPNSHQAALWLAKALIRQNKTDAAKETLVKLLQKLEGLPEKHDEYVEASILLSGIYADDNSLGAKTRALQYLDGAVDYAPNSAEARVSRAQFYRLTSDLSGISEQDRLAAARTDLETVNQLSPENPRTHLFLGQEWMALGELDQASFELRAVENPKKEILSEYYLDLHNWIVDRFLFAAKLMTRRGNLSEGVSWTDKTLSQLTETRHRLRVLPAAVRLYVEAGKVPQARQCLDEYLDALHTQKGRTVAKLELVYMQALVARAEERLFTVINVLEPYMVNDVSYPELWRLLAEAYSRTDQSRRAVAALTQYLRLRPDDSAMTIQLTKEYIKMRDWSRAAKAMRLAESLGTTNAIVKLLRIETSLRLASEEAQGINIKRLEGLDAELAELQQEDPTQADVRVLRAQVALALGQPDEAEEVLKRAIIECEESLRAELQLAKYYHRAKRVTEAIRVCQDACENHPEVAQPWLCLSDLHTANADYDAARTWLRQGLGAVVDKWEKRSISVKLASTELMHGERTVGMAILQDLAAHNEYEVYARSLLLGLPEVQQDHAAAEKLTAELRQAEGERGLMWRKHQALLWLTSTQWRSRQQDIADLLEFCIDADPKWSAPALLLVDMYEKLGDAEHVEDICRQTLVRNPAATEVADRLVILLAKQGRFSDAEDILKQIEVKPQTASAWRIRTAMGAGNFSQAINELKLRISNDDGDANSRLLLARLIYQETKNADLAFSYLKEAEALMSDTMALTAVRASILRAEGKVDAARMILDEYVAKSEGFEAYMLRGSHFANEGDFEQAEANYRKLTTFREKAAQGYEILSNFYARNKKLDQAIATLNEGTTAFPADLHLQRRLMKTLLVRGQAQDRQRAMTVLAALEEQQPQDPELMTFRAFQALEEATPQSRDAAKEILERVTSMEPTAVNAHLALINTFVQEGDYEAARAHTIRALGSNQKNLKLLCARARVELATENIQMADELAHMVLQQDPNHPEGRDLLVGAALRSRSPSLLKEAKILLESAMHGNAHDERLHLSYAQVLAAMDLAPDAIPQMEAYCQTKQGSSSPDAFAMLADLYRLAGNMEQAWQALAQAERPVPHQQTVVHARLRLLIAQNRWAELVGISSAYIAAQDQNLATVMAAASILVTADSVELQQEGLKLFEHAVSLAPTLLKPRLELASALYQVGHVERAKQAYQELLAQYPNNLRILNDLAWILQEHDRDYDAALELANRGLRYSPNNPYLLDTRGTILSKMSTGLIDAKKDFEKLLEMSQADTRLQGGALLQLGRVCAKLNDPVLAKQHLRKALEIDREIHVFTPDEQSEIMYLVGENTK